MIRIELDTPARDDVARHLDEHLTDMFAASPAEIVHPLSPSKGGQRTYP